MKKYFAKYLPVEGEIKEGDKVRHNGQVVIALKKEGEGDTWKTDGFPIYGSNLAKVKLFLCSRDIEVGDKVEVWDNHIFLYKGEVSCLWDKKKGRRKIKYATIKGDFPERDCIKDACIKVIGEISPDALWVKEGDEFNEDDVEEWWGHSETHYPMMKKLSEGIDEKLLEQNCPIVYKVFSPCGHFH